MRTCLVIYPLGTSWFGNYGNYTTQLINITCQITIPNNLLVTVTRTPAPVDEGNVKSPRPETGIDSTEISHIMHVYSSLSVPKFGCCERECPSR